MFYLPVILITLIGLVVVTRPFTILFHELGHALPALILTKDRVTVYVGSYGDKTGCFNTNLGLLEIWIKYNPLSWWEGLCVPSAEFISINRQIAYTLMGPLASLIVGGVSCYLAFTYDMHGLLKTLLLAFLASAFFDLITNLNPDPRPIKLPDGKTTYCDGYSLWLLFQSKKYGEEYGSAVALYNEQKYSEAGNILNKLLQRNFQFEQIYRLALSSAIQSNNYGMAKQHADDFIKTGTMNAIDYINAGIGYSQLGMREQGIGFYDEALKMEPNNPYALNNKAFSLNILNRYEEAITLLDKAIGADKKFAYAYTNRGLAKIMTGYEEEGLADLKKSYSLNTNNSYTFRNLGIYHLHKKEPNEALEMFKKAKDINSKTADIDELIQQAVRLTKTN